MRMIGVKGWMIIKKMFFSLFFIINSHNLKILGLISSDAGMFQCIGMNPAGSVQTSAFLEVVPAGEFSFLC